MIYKIQNKYYIRVGKDFTEVELVFTDNDVDLKPTQNIIENNGNIAYEELNFLNIKAKLLEEYKKSSVEEIQPDKLKNKNKNFLRSSFR